MKEKKFRDFPSHFEVEIGKPIMDQLEEKKVLLMYQQMI
jgi:hypothetical protein